MKNDEITSELNLLKKRLVLEEARMAEVEKENRSLKRKAVDKKMKYKQLENARKENQNTKKNMTFLKEKFDAEETNVKVLEELLKGIYDDYTTKCGEVEESKRTIHELQNDKRTALAAKEATEAALYGYQEAMEENDTLRNKNNELLRKVSILESKMEERNDWKARYEDEERKSKELNLNLEKSNELLDLLSHQLGKEVAEMKKLARQDMVKVPKTKKAQRRSR